MALLVVVDGMQDLEKEATTLDRRRSQVRGGRGARNQDITEGTPPKKDRTCDERVRLLIFVLLCTYFIVAPAVGSCFFVGHYCTAEKKTVCARYGLFFLNSG